MDKRNILEAKSVNNGSSIVNLLTDKSKYIKKMSYLKPRERILATITIVIIILCTWFFVIHTRLQSKIKKNKTTFTQKRKQVNTLKNHKNKCKKLETKIQNIKKDINKNTNKKSIKNIAQYNINDMITYAKLSGISLKSYATLEEMVDQHLVNKQKVSYEFNCDLNKALIFCSKLKRCKRSLECQELKISISDKNTCNLKCILEFSHLKPAT